MKADPFVQAALLDVQTLDSRIDHLDHQLRHLPEAQRLAEAEQRHETAHNRVRDLQVQASDLTWEQKRADADVESVKARRDRDQSMIDAGSVKDPKALTHMLEELRSLQRRISALEDVELDVMERLEQVENDLTSAQSEAESLSAEMTTLRVDLDEKTAQLRAERESVVAERTQTAAGLPADLTQLYERLRAAKNGVGAAALIRRGCTGCRLSLNASDLAEIAKAPSDEVIRCEECERILVRTVDSGL